MGTQNRSSGRYTISSTTPLAQRSATGTSRDSTDSQRTAGLSPPAPFQTPQKQHEDHREKRSPESDGGRRPRRASAPGDLDQKGARFLLRKRRRRRGEES